MEIESENGSKIRLQQNFDLGRGLGGFNSTDRTVSRHHLSFNLHQDGTGVYFQVNGKNPIWVRHCHCDDDDDDDIRVYKSSERGELKTGDSFCVSSKNPVWFHLKKIACQEDEAFDEIETGDISDLDPVKEFSFVVMGHEFDCYTKKMVRDIKNWNWFLEEPNKDSDEKKTRKGGTIKRKKGGSADDDDDIWTGESEEDVELVKKSRNDLKPKYSTRSKDKNKKGTGASKSAKDNAKRKVTSGDEDDDDDDETLGGFIVDDEDVGEGNEENDEEEEFEEDEDDE